MTDAGYQIHLKKKKEDAEVKKGLSAIKTTLKSLLKVNV